MTPVSVPRPPAAELMAGLGLDPDSWQLDVLEGGHARLVRSQFVTAVTSEISRSQSVILKRGANIKYRSYAFTKQIVAMLSSVLRSKRAVPVNIEIMRAFVRMRQILAAHADQARKLEALEQKYDAQFKVVFDAIRQLMAPPPADVARSRRRIGCNGE